MIVTYAGDDLYATETTVKDFKMRSFIEWDFQDEFYSRLDRDLQRTDLQLMFRTRQSTALLFKAQNAQKSEYVVLEVSIYRTVGISLYICLGRKKSLYIALSFCLNKHTYMYVYLGGKKALCSDC